MADYYLAETGRVTPGRSEGLYAPGSAWWGGGATELGLAGAVGDDTFVALFDRAEHPDGSGRHVGRRFRQPAAASVLAEAATAAADRVDDPYRRWMAKHELKRKGPQASWAAWDCIHDQAAPTAVLSGIATALGAGGVFLMADVDVKASSYPEENVDIPWAPFLYATSVLHCMTVSLALDGTGLGTVWGEQTAIRMLHEAGFTTIRVEELEGDFFNSFFIATID